MFVLSIPGLKGIRGKAGAFEDSRDAYLTDFKLSGFKLPGYGLPGFGFQNSVFQASLISNCIDLIRLSAKSSADSVK